MRVLRSSFLLALALSLACGCARFARQPLVGTIITTPVAAKDFTLVDHRGKPFTMSSTKGKVVVLAFIYSHCDHLSPFIALKIKAVRDLLGPQADKVAFVAITTDPERDTVEVAAAYSKAAGLEEGWSFLTGSPPELPPVWAAYAVGVHREEEGSMAGMGMEAMRADAEKGLGEADLAVARSMVREFSGGYVISHSAPFWFVDPSGKLRAILNANALPEDIVTNVRALAR